MNDNVEGSLNQLSGMLTLAREQKDMSMDEVAEKLNLSSKQLDKFEDSNLKIQELSTFERGYLRNYAALLEVDLSEFEEDFPSGISIGSELQSIQRDGYKTTKPIMSRLSIKMILLALVIGLLIWLVFSSGIDFSQMDLNKTLEKATEMTLPNPME